MANSTANPSEKASKTISLENGQIKLFQQKGSKRWQFFIKLAGKSRVKFLTGTSDLEDAKTIAQNQLDEARILHRKGMPIKEITFEKAAQSYLKHCDQRVNANEPDLSAKRVYNIKSSLNTHIMPAFGKKTLQLSI